MHKMKLFLYIYSVPNEIISSVRLFFNPTIAVLGDSITATCTVQLNFSLSGCDIEFNYGFITETVPGGAGVTLYNFATISAVNLSFAGEYTCTVAVVGGPFCPGVEPGQLFIPRTSDTVTLRVQCA